MVNLCINFDTLPLLYLFLLSSFFFFFSLLFILSTQSFSYRYSEGGDEPDNRFFGLLSCAGVPAKPTGDIVVDTGTIYQMSRATRGIAVIINNKNFLISSGMDKYPRNWH